MLFNEIKLARRKLWNKKRSSYTKLFSLVLGIVSVFYIAIYVHYEFSFEDFHGNARNIVKVNTKIQSPTGNLDLGLTAIPIGPYIKSESPQVKDYVRINKEHGSHSIRYGNHLFSESENIYYTDSSFFEVFSFGFLAGNAETALTGPDKIILTEESAAKYFGSKNPLNEILLYDGNPYTVSGIVENVPSNSHLQFDFLISMDTFLKERPEAAENWGWFPMNTYLLLNDNTDPSIVANQLGQVPQYLEPSNTNDQYFLSIELLKGLHLSSAKLGELGTKGKLSNLYILIGVGLMIFLLAIFNFINLTTAEVSTQGKTVSVRKTLGASKKDVFRQFFVESILLTSIATLVSILIILISFTSFEQFLGSTIDLSLLSNPLVLIGLPLVPVMLSMLGGIYPAVLFAKIRAIYLPKPGGKQSQYINTRTSLLVFQFSITSILVVGSLLIYYQLNYMENQDLGMDTSQKLVLEYGPNGEIGTSYESLKQEFGKIPGVEGVTFSSHVPGQVPNGVSTQIKGVNGRTNSGEISLNLIDHDFIKDYGLQLIAGREFREGPADNNTALILNESAVKAFGYADPNDILGATFEQWGGNGEVIGVVKDFNYLSLHENIGLLSLKIWPEQFMKISFQISESNIKETLASIRTKWTALYPNIPFNHYFVDDNFQAQYLKDQQFATIINVFTLISICIGILGLIAYANFWCERRRKEMSIRKVLGANASRLAWKLYQGFSIPVLIGFSIAIPVSYYLGNQWLQGFAYRFDLNWYFFATPLLILLTLVCMAVGAQTIGLVFANPAHNLKEE
ncbi:ABC transporter permease [Flagellimonas sp. 2504JD4-2]